MSSSFENPKNIGKSETIKAKDFFINPNPEIEVKSPKEGRKFTDNGKKREIPKTLEGLVGKHYNNLPEQVFNNRKSLPDKDGIFQKFNCPINASCGKKGGMDEGCEACMTLQIESKKNIK